MRKAPKVTVSQKPFDLWDYEKGLVSKGVVLLALFFTLWGMDIFLFPAVRPGQLLPWVLAFFCCAPFLMYAFGKAIPCGKTIFSWNPDWSVTGYYRRWFRTQYSTGFMTLAVLAYTQRSYFLTTGFFTMVMLFITYTWLLESKISITKKGIATYSGLLAWDAITEIKLFPRSTVMVLTVSGPGKYLIPYAIYHVPRPLKAQTAIEKALKDISGADDKKV